MSEPMEVDENIAVTCICGDPQCDNSLERRELQNLPLYTHQHKRRLHGALQSADCASVCQLLQSGMQFCTAGEDNCFVHIVKHCNASFLDSALTMQPDAVNCRGELGYTLLMLCDDVEKMQVVLRHGPDLQVVNDRRENVLLHYVKHRLFKNLRQIWNSFQALFETPEFHIDGEDAAHKTKVQNMVDASKAMLECIVRSGVDVNAKDALGRTALEKVLSIFKCGYVFQKYHHKSYWGEMHFARLCHLENDLAAHALHTILQAKPELPPADEEGATALMLACLSPWNLASIELLLQRGIDVNETNYNDSNAMFYLLRSFECHGCQLECLEFSEDMVSAVDKILCLLLDNGCEKQGMNIVLSEPVAVLEHGVTVFKHLMCFRDSCLNRRDFPEKRHIKNDPNSCSFLEHFIQDREATTGSNERMLVLDDVAFLAKEIADGLDVRQDVFWDTGELFTLNSNWSDKMSIPNALRRTVYMKVANCLNPEHYVESSEEYFQALDGIQHLLLPFWPYPPLALLVFFACYVRRETPLLDDRCERFVHFLHDIGGPLTPGSELYQDTRESLQSAVQRNPNLHAVLQVFDKLHEKIPSLLQLSRTALRASLKNVDTEGLDVSSLKVRFQGELRCLPTPIRKYLNFCKLPAKPAVGAEDPQAS